MGQIKCMIKIDFTWLGFVWFCFALFLTWLLENFKLRVCLAFCFCCRALAGLWCGGGRQEGRGVWASSVAFKDGLDEREGQSAPARGQFSPKCVPSFPSTRNRSVSNLLVSLSGEDSHPPPPASQAPHSPNIRVLERELGCGMLRNPCMAAFVSHTQRGKCLPVPKPPAQSCQAVPTRFSS